MSGHDLQPPLDHEFRRVVTTTRPSSERLAAHTFKIYEAIDGLNSTYQDIIADRLTTQPIMWRAFCPLPKAPKIFTTTNRVERTTIDEAEGAGRDTPMPRPGVQPPPGFEVQFSAFMDLDDNTSSDPETDTNRSLEETSRPLVGEDKETGNFPADHEENVALSPPKAPDADTEDTEMPLLDDEGDERMSDTAKDHQQSPKDFTIHSDHPLPPLPPAPPDMISLTVDPGDMLLSPRHQTDFSPPRQFEAFVPSMPEFSEEGDIGLMPCPPSPVLSPATLPTVGSTPRSDDVDMTDTAETSSDVTRNSSGDSTDSDSDDDYETVSAGWKVLETHIHIFTARMNEPETDERFLHRLLEHDCKSWCWAEHLTDYTKRLNELQLEAWTKPQGRVYFPYTAWLKHTQEAEQSQRRKRLLPSSPDEEEDPENRGSQLRKPKHDSEGNRALERQIFKTTPIVDMSCHGESLTKPAKGPDTLANMIERRLLQRFKDRPEAGPLSAKHIEMLLKMLIQCNRLKYQQHEKMRDLVDSSHQRHRRDMYSCRPADDDGTYLLRSKGMNSTLAEVISADEEWPEGWGITMVRPERYKIAGKDKRDPMKLLLKSLSTPAEEEL